ncbi:MAG: lysine--tRNA ligase [Candidatus Micrarchaeota archaeon]
MSSLHWADQLAEKIIERCHREKCVPNVKCQQTPSGGKHIGNLNDVMRAYFPYKAVLEKGEKCEFVHTTDDRDPLKDIPAKLADLDGNWHDAAKFPELKSYYGKALVKTPDPFGCCSSYAAHFTNVWMTGLEMIDVKPKLYSVDALYKQGKFDPYIKMVFEKREAVGKIVSDLQASKDTSYIPFDAFCPQCGVLANVDEFDIKNKKVHFMCGGKSINKKKAEGCGFEGWEPWSEGKLQWRFEWPALMAIFNTTFEPFGKDHAEGSWKSVLRIMPEIFNKEPPIPFVYEFFLVNGEKMSASKGNVYIVQDMLKIMEKDVFKFYYVKRPEKQRDLDLTKIFQLEDEFDAAEKAYFGKADSQSENREENAKRMYDLAVSQPPVSCPNRVSFSFCAALAQLMPVDAAVDKLKELKHIETKQDALLAKQRLMIAKTWAAVYGGEHKLSVLSLEVAAVKKKSLSENQVAALIEFANLLKTRGASNETEQLAAIRDICKKCEVTPSDFFAAAYSVLIGKSRGPKLFTLISVIGSDVAIDLFAS